MKVKTTKGLKSELDQIARYFDQNGGPREPHPEPRAHEAVTRRFVAEAKRRARAIRAAQAALLLTRNERGVIRSPLGTVRISPICVSFNTAFSELGRSAQVELQTLADALAEAADVHDNLAKRKPKPKGRKADALMEWLVGEVALACLRHGVMFRDSASCPATTHLKAVLAKVSWAVGTSTWAPERSDEGIRHYARMAMEIQQNAQGIGRGVK